MIIFRTVGFTININDVGKVIVLLNKERNTIKEGKRWRKIK